MRVSFKKYVGCGNDFVIFDNRHQDFPQPYSPIVKKLCDRRFGVGADGLLLLEKSAKADAKMRIFNADGSEAEMCGNGVRCFVAWLKTLGFPGSIYTIETLHRTLTAYLQDSDIVVDMGPPRDVQWHIEIKLLDQILIGHYLNTGVPHLVIFVKDVEKIDVLSWGAALRNYSLWRPQGTNVDFVEILKQKIKIRTFERGVEGETLACGTGAVAAALATAYLEKKSDSILVETRSGENLRIVFSLEGQNFSKVGMTGPAYCVFSGEINLAALG